MALVAVAGGLGALLVSGLNGAPGATLFAGLMVLLAATSILYLRTRWPWPQVVAVGGAFVLLVVWQAGGQLAPLLLLTGLAAAWILGAITSFGQRVSGDEQGAALLGLGGAGAALLTATVTAGLSAHLAGLAGALLAAQGLIHDQLPGKRQSTGQILLIAGLGLGATGAYLWLGSLGLAIGLGALSILLLILGGRHESRTLDIAALISAGCQAVVMATCHPALHQASSFSWHTWSLGSLAVAFQLGWIWWSWKKRSAAEHQPARVLEGLYMSQAVYVLAALSTELSLLVDWIPAMTLLWTGAATALWVLGRRGKGLRVVAVLCMGAAFVKLLAFDWALLGGGTRVALMMIVGTTMLVTPLLSPDGKVDHRQQVSC